MKGVTVSEMIASLDLVVLNAGSGPTFQEHRTLDNDRKWTVN